jgi:hypothetical protein
VHPYYQPGGRKAPLSDDTMGHVDFDFHGVVSGGKCYGVCDLRNCNGRGGLGGDEDFASRVFARAWLARRYPCLFQTRYM